MEICNGTEELSHDEICFDEENGDCPLCSFQQETRYHQLQDEIKSLKETIREREQAIYDLRLKYEPGTYK